MAEPAVQPSQTGLAHDVTIWRKAILSLSVEMRQDLADLFTRAALAAARLGRRDDVLANMAAGLPGKANAQAKAIHVILLRYAASAWPIDRKRDAPRDDKNALAYRMLVLTDGEVPSARTIRRWLAKLATQGRCNGQDRRR